MPWFLAFFVLSGFCALVYEVVWLRLAMAGFGVTTPLVSTVLAAFMAGLALGNWGGGRVARSVASRPGAWALRLYAASELVIAGSAHVVPTMLAAGRRLLTTGATEWGSGSYHLASAAWITLTVLPFCTAMGATTPLAMAALRRLAPRQSERSFSFLYMANLVGSVVGTLVSAFVLIEVFGFRGTLQVASLVNALIAATALALSLRTLDEGADAAAAEAAPAGHTATRTILLALFVTGCTSMGMEVVWVRQFTPYLGTVVYAFAAILALYLSATFLGSHSYRSRVGRIALERQHVPAWLWALIGVAALLPLALADPRLPWAGGIATGLLRVAIGVGPLCAGLGFVTPLLVDRWSAGEPARGGLAYAVNVVGCILGPLLAGFVLLPWAGERLSLLLLAVPLMLLALTAPAAGAAAPLRLRRGPALAVAAFLAVVLFASTLAYESIVPGAVVRRDSTSTVAAARLGAERFLLVNGINMTSLTPITKFMAHLPLAFLPRQPRDCLIICFGMGTSFRSALSWGIETTAVELTPSVPELFGYFHPDAGSLVRSPRARIVIDDGRRFLERSQRRFDVIVIDPPPPVEASGSSLLYSREFYDVLKRRLRPGGIVQQWFPQGEPLIEAAFVRTFSESFPHARYFGPVHATGLHMLGSDRPIAPVPAGVLASRLPPAARADLAEWGPLPTAEAQLERVLARELPLARMDVHAGVPLVTDDRPVNEYYWLRRTLRAVLAGRAHASGSTARTSGPS